LIGAGLLALAGGVYPRPSQATKQKPPPRKPETHHVEIRRFRFVPAQLSIRRGDTVEWRNADFAPHTATGKNGGWDTGKLGRKEAAAITFDEPGHHAYYCVYHPHMTGEIIIAEEN